MKRWSRATWAHLLERFTAVVGIISQLGAPLVQTPVQRRDDEDSTAVMPTDAAVVMPTDGGMSEQPDGDDDDGRESRPANIPATGFTFTAELLDSFTGFTFTAELLDGPAPTSPPS